MGRAVYIVSLPSRSFVSAFERGNSGIFPKYTATIATRDRTEAARLSYNVAQAVARKMQGLVLVG